MPPLEFGIPNCLTFDIEEWFHVNYKNVEVTPFRAVYPERLRVSVDRLLGLCEEARIRCTFFVLGVVAESFPDVVKRIAAAGHEVASHSHGHHSVSALTRAAFRDDLDRSCDVLERLTGQRVLGYRAPSFSVTEAVLPWYYEALERRGLEYSSSVFCGRTFLYGIPDFPYRVHMPNIGGTQTRITEFPVTRVRFFGKTLGLYVRLFPAAFLRRCVLNENVHGRPGVLYVHPREVDPGQPRLPLGRVTSMIHYYGVGGCEKKLRTFLRTTPGRFVRMVDALQYFRGPAGVTATEA